MKNGHVARERGASMGQGMVTVFAVILGIIGTLCGSVVQNFLSRSTQREQWMRDRRLEEFRELLVSLTASMYAEVEAMYKTELLPKEREDKERKTADFFQVVQTRIFTFTDVRRLDLQGKWLTAVNAYRTSNSHDIKTLENEYKTLSKKLVDAAITPRATI
jgi:hypothetical protein